MKRYAREYHYIYAFLICMLSVNSCALSEKQVSSAQTDPAIEEEEKLLFLSCSIARDSSIAGYMISILDKTIVKGKLKTAATEINKPENGSLSYILKDQHSEELLRGYFINPLIQNIEYVNDEGQLERQIIYLDSAQFTLRIPMIANAKLLEFEEYKDSNSTAIYLFSTNIYKDEQE